MFGSRSARSKLRPVDRSLPKAILEALPATAASARLQAALHFDKDAAEVERFLTPGAAIISMAFGVGLKASESMAKSIYIPGKP